MHQRNKLLKLTVCLTTALLSACNPIYVTRAAFQEARILLAREDIEELLQSTKLDGDTAFKLNLTLKAREFANSIGIKTGRSYASYSDIGRQELAWIVMAARPYAFEMATWWFPIVGRVPYRGFFEKEEANIFAADLERQGYEVWVRSSDAFSTLGWFNDPLLSTTLRYPAHVVVNTVLHEMFHATVWIKNDVVWNESAANFFAHQATIAFFENQLANTDSEEAVLLQRELSAAKQANKAELLLANVLTVLYEALQVLYQDSNRSRDEILAVREQVFDLHSQPFRAAFPESRALKRINNAEIMALRTYLTGFAEFSKQFEDCREELPCLLNVLESKDSA